MKQFKIKISEGNLVNACKTLFNMQAVTMASYTIDGFFTGTEIAIIVVVPEESEEKFRSEFAKNIF